MSTPAPVPQHESPTPSTSRRSTYGTRAGGRAPAQVGLADPAWTRLATAGIVPILLAVTTSLPAWVRLALVLLLVPLTAQGWPALVRSQHDRRSAVVVTVTGLAAVLAVAVTQDFGSAGVIMGLSVLAAFTAQMLRSDGRPGLVEDLSATVTGDLVVVCGAGWCALEPGVADPAIIVPCCLALLIGALLTTLQVRALVLESLTVTVPALAAGTAGGVLAAIGFFGPAHAGTTAAFQSAGACLLCGFVAGILMAASNRVLWTHRWVPGGRAAVASAIVPILAVGGPVYAIARLMGGFIAG